MPLPNIDRTSLLNQVNLYFLLGGEELTQLATPRSLPHLRASSSSHPFSSSNYDSLHATLQSIQGKQAFLLVYIQTKHSVLRDFV